MPRTRQKTRSGAPAQTGPPVAGQTYGQGAEQQQLAEVLPTPAVAQVPTTPQGVAGVQVGPPPAAYDHAAAVAAAGALRDETGLLQAPTTRPNEPITAGLSRGPGAGPEALGMIQGTPAGDLLRRLSAATNDPLFAELAAKARA